MELSKHFFCTISILTLRNFLTFSNITLVERNHLLTKKIISLYDICAFRLDRGFFIILIGIPYIIIYLTAICEKLL